MPDAFSSHAASLTSSLVSGFAITPSDTGELQQWTRQIRVTGAAGNIAVVWADGTTSIEPVQANETLDWRLRRVNQTGTTATGIRGYF